MNRIYKSAKGYYKYCILSPLCVILEAIIEILIPLVMKNLVDIGLSANDTSYVIVCSLVIIGMGFLSLIFGIGSGYFATKASAGLGKNIRKELYEKLQSFSFSNIEKFSTSSLITRLTTDVTNVQSSFQMTIRICFRAPIMFFVTLVTVFMNRVDFGLIYLCIIPVLIIIVVIVVVIANKYFRQMFKKIDKMNLTVQENINGIRTVKSYTNEDHETAKFVKASEEVKHFGVKAEALGSLFNPVAQFLMYASTILICFASARLMVGENATMTTGDLQLFLSYGSIILSSLLMVCAIIMMLIMSKASIDRVNEVLAEEPDIKNPANPVKEVKDGSVEFKNVTFAYNSTSDNHALTDVSFKINSGDTVGIFGPTGSSKSTLISLIDRLYDTTEGEVLVGGVNVKDYDLYTLREACSVVLQKNTLFSGTIKSNLKWGKEDATDEEIIAACNHAQASEFIERMPDKYDSRVEEGGVNFSGGQKQRLCIARALLKKPKILILDDSTSAVDTKTDAKIRDAFNKEIPNTTKFIISQRISSIQNADKIILLDNGKIVAMGDHEHLLKESKEYKTIFESQLKASPKGGK